MIKNKNPFLLGRAEAPAPPQFATVAQVRFDGRARLTGSVFTGSKIYCAVAGPEPLAPGDRVTVRQASGTYYITGKVDA